MVQKRHWGLWLPVVVWLAALTLESSNLGSSDRTRVWLAYIWNSLFGNPDPEQFELVHHVLRKTGHFLGYGLLSLLIFRAVRGTWQLAEGAIAHPRDYYWQLRWSALALLGTLVAASADEIHQSFNPVRTGRWQDVALDCSGALLVQVLLYLSLPSGRGNAQSRQIKAEV